MKHVSHRQKGMTAIGIFIILAMIACFIAFGFRLFPLFNLHTSVKSTLVSVANQPYKSRATSKKIRELFVKNAKVNGVYKFDRNNIKEHLKIKKSKDGKKYMNFSYQDTQPLFHNYYLMIDIEEILELPGE